MTSTPAPSGLAADLHRYLQRGRDAMLASLDGLSEHAVRRPMTPTGTNLLGLVKHVCGVELGYFGTCLGRPAPFTLPWFEDGSVWGGADMWATAEQSRDDLVALYRRVWAHSDESFATLPLDAPASVAWWPEERAWWPEERRHTTFGRLAVHTVAETAQHAGHADIVRELIDGRGGRDQDQMGDVAYWKAHVAALQQVADQFAEPAAGGAPGSTPGG